MGRTALLAYLLLVHAALAVAWLRPDAIPELHARLGWGVRGQGHIQVMRAFHARSDAVVPAGAALFLGDSLVQGMPVDAVAPVAVNYGIGWQTSAQLLETMRLYGSLSRAGIVFVAIGSNDVHDGVDAATVARRLQAVQDAIPAGIPLVWSAIPPRHAKDAAAVRSINARIGAMCLRRVACAYVDTWQFLADVDGRRIERHYVDPVHPGPRGYAAWVRALQAARREALAARPRDNAGLGSQERSAP